MSVRTAGRRGRLPAKTGSDKLAIGWVHSYLAQPLPAPVYPVDVSGGIKDWLMLGNGPDPSVLQHPDGVGDCTFAGRQHYRMAKAAAGSISLMEHWETAAELVDEYLQYDHGQDVGAVIADLLLAWYKAGKILAFAPVDHTDPAAVDSAMAAFHGAYCGVDLTDDADELFQQGEPWTVAGGQHPDPSDGHCIVKVGSDGQSLHNVATGTAYDTWVTWGALQKSSLGWSAAALQEAWVIITEEDADAASLDIAKLRADIDALHGTGGAPAPAPVPARPVASFLAELADEVAAIASKVRTFLASL